MRRALRRLTVGAATTSLALFLLPPAFAEGSVDLDLGDDGGSANAKVEVKDPGSGDDGGSDDSSTGSGNESSDPPGSSAEGDGNPPVESSSEPRTESVDPSRTENAGNYGSGSPESVSSEPSGPNIDPTKPIYYAGTGSTNAQPAPGAGGNVAVIDGGIPPPAAEPEEPAADEPAPEEPAADEPAAPQVDPADLAETAVSQMGLQAPSIGSTPNDPDTLGAVGLPVWLWVDNPGETTTGPNTTSATAGDVTVTATAKFSGMSIDMGDGTTIECDGPGTEYPGTGIEPSPDCGHVYEQMSDDQPDGLYTVDITAHWSVDWESNTGEGGQIPIDLTTDKQLRIGSYQTVVTDVS